MSSWISIKTNFPVFVLYIIGNVDFSNTDLLLFSSQNCTAAKNQAVSTCFSLECASYNGNKPIRYCRTCHLNRHAGAPGNDHVFHMTVSDVWSSEPELQSYLVEAIVA